MIPVDVGLFERSGRESLDVQDDLSSATVVTAHLPPTGFGGFTGDAKYPRISFFVILAMYAPVSTPTISSRVRKKRISKTPFAKGAGLMSEDLTRKYEERGIGITNTDAESESRRSGPN